MNNKDPNKQGNPLLLYAKYSSIVFQMLAIIGLSFWGGRKLNDYYNMDNNLLTVVIGLTGFALALYNTVIKLNQINKNED